LKSAFWIILALLGMPPQARATDSCFDCVLGIWDDPAMTRNHGSIIVGQPKYVYVGIKFAGGHSRLWSVSFSIAGLRQLLVLAEEPLLPALVFGSVPAPADTSMSSQGLGGIDIGWYSCLVGDQALLRVTLLASSEATNQLLQVKRKYSTGFPDVSTPFFNQCDPPDTRTRATGGYYILNWDGDPTVRVDGVTWSAVKEIYR
jgi:hypothetical protein